MKLSNESIRNKINRGQLSFIGFDQKRLHKRLERTQNIIGRPERRTLNFALAAKNSQCLHSEDGARLDYTGRIIIPSGSLIPDDTKTTLFRKAYAYSPERISTDTELEIHEPVVFGGAMIHHFGHFLTDTLSRLWILRELPPEIRIVFLTHAGQTLDFFLKRAWIRDTLSAFGINHERIILVDRPTIFRNIIVPQPAIEHAFRIYSAYTTSYEYAAERFETASANGPYIYLSRSMLASDPRGCRSDEQALEQRLAANGFKILHPETMTIAEQVSTFRSASVVAGMIGSAFHNSLFVENPNLQIIYLAEENIYERYLIIDGAKMYKSTYVNCIQSARLGSELVRTLDVNSACHEIFERI